MAEVTSSGQKRVSSNDGTISLNQGENAIKVETKTKAVAPVSQGGRVGDIQRAIDRLLLTGGVVTIRNGTYVESANITLPSNVSVEGESFGGVVIAFSGAYSVKATGTLPYSTGTIAVTYNSTTVTGTDTTWLTGLTTNHKIRINGIPYSIASVDDDMTLTLTDAYVGQPLTGIPYIASILVEKPQLKNLIISSPVTAVDFQYTDLASINNVVCPSPGGNGFSIIGSSRFVANVFLVESSGGSGLIIQSTSFVNMERVLATNCGGDGFQVTESSGIVFTSCPANGNGGNGYNVDSSSSVACMISQANGNAGNGVLINDTPSCILNGGDFSGNLGDGVKLSGDSSLNILASVIANGNGAYGINIADPSCVNNRITGCQLLGNTTDDINDLGTNTVILQDGNPDLTNYFNKLTDTLDDITDGSVYVKSENNYDDSAVTKLGGIATGATANSKATGSELDTGTDDVKFATAKALKDSHNVPSVAPSTAGKLLRSDGTDWTSASVTTADIAESTDKNYITDAEATVIGNTSGTNTGDQTLPTSIDDLNPDQTGQSGKFLTTDGSNASWGTPAGSGDMEASTYDPATITEQLVGLTATQTLTNKTLTSPVINTGVSGTAILDEDNMASDSATKLATQQSIKAYVDAEVAGAGGGMTWSEVTGTSQSASINNGYVTNNAGLVTVTIPTTAAVGSVVRIAGKGAGGWKVAQNASEIIHFGTVDTTTGTGGSLASTDTNDAVELLCIVANTEWMVISSQGNITIV